MSQGLILFIGIFLIVLLAAILVLIIYWQGLSNAVFIYCFKRGSEERWMRGGCADASDKKMYRMWEDGVQWAQDNNAYLAELETYNEKERLAAQYYDFGFDKAVIIVPGMYQTSTYSLYFADLWKKAGFNCLLIDNRATGNSGGEYNSIGFYESGDISRWAALLNTQKGIRRILLHGISVGASSCLLTLAHPRCPAYLAGMVCDEAYYQFTDFFRNYMISKRYNTIAFKTVLKKIYRITGADPKLITPSAFADKVDVPVLFIAGKEDGLISEEQTSALYSACGSGCGNSCKELVWFENGEHGFLRFFNTDAYDSAIEKFLTDYHFSS